MSNFLQSLKRFPWQELLKVAGLTNLIVAGVEILLGWGFQQSIIVYNVVTLLYSPPLGILIPCVAAVGMGALAVYWCEQQSKIFLNRANLWVLVLCLLLGLLLKALLPIPTFLVGLSQTALVGIAIGVFWKGRPYWR